MGPSRVAQAKIMYERVITGRGTTLGKEHPQTLIVMNHLANLLQVTDLPPPPCRNRRNREHQSMYIPSRRYTLSSVTSLFPIVHTLSSTNQLTHKSINQSIDQSICYSGTRKPTTPTTRTRRNGCSKASYRGTKRRVWIEDKG